MVATCRERECYECAFLIWSARAILLLRSSCEHSSLHSSFLSFLTSSCTPLFFTQVKILKMYVLQNGVNTICLKVKGHSRIRYNYSVSDYDLAKKFRIRPDPDPQQCLSSTLPIIIIQSQLATVPAPTEKLPVGLHTLHEVNKATGRSSYLILSSKNYR
jgi:hypothetical protein